MNGRWAIAIAVAALVVASPVGSYPYGPVKHVIVLTGGLLLVGLPGRDRRWGPAVILVAAAMVTAVAALTGPEPLTGLIGTPDRRYGALTWLAMAGYARAGLNLTAGERVALCRAGALGSVILGLWAMIQLVDGAGRTGSLLGQPAYLGAALALVIPLSVGAAAGGDQLAGGGWRGIGLLGTAAGLAGLAASGSRGAAGGLLVAGLAAAVLRGHSGLRWVIASLVAGGGALWVALSDVSLSSVWATGSGAPITRRFDEWAVGWSALRAAPALGYGPEGYRTVFGRFVDAPYVQTYGREVITDRAHNAVLDVGLSGGAIALFLVAGLWVLVITGALVAIRSGPVAAAALGGASVAYLTQSMVLFPLAEVDPVFWLAAGAVVPAGVPAPPQRLVLIGRRMDTVAGPVVVGLAAAVAVAGLVEVARDDVPWSFRSRFVAAQQLLEAGDVGAAAEENHAGLRLAPADPALRLQRTGLVDGEERLALLRDLAVVSEPNHPLVHKLRGRAELDAGNPAIAERAWRTAADLEPAAVDALIALAALQIERGNETAARQTLLEAVARSPGDPVVARLVDQLNR